MVYLVAQHLKSSYDHTLDGGATKGKSPFPLAEGPTSEKWGAAYGSGAKDAYSELMDHYPDVP